MTRLLGLETPRYLIKPKGQIFLKGYGFLYFA